MSALGWHNALRMNLPSASVQLRIREGLLQEARIEPRAVPVLGVLFQNTITAALENRAPSRLKVSEILQQSLRMQKHKNRNGREKDGPASEQSTRAALTHLRKRLEVFFNQDGKKTGKQEKAPREFFTIKIEEGSHILQFIPKRYAGEKVRKFWGDYFSTFAPTCLYYPAPQFFRHKTGSYIRHRTANWQGQGSEITRLLKLQSGTVRPTSSFVASGMTGAVIRFFGCFFRDDTMLEAKSLGPTDIYIEWERDTIIVLGTPTTSLDLIKRIERGMPYRTQLDEKGVAYFCHESLPIYLDQDEEASFDREQVNIKKHVLVTRLIEYREDREDQPHFERRLCTLLSGHSRAVQAVTSVLTSEESVTEVLTKFRGKLPKEFQIIFEVSFDTRYGELKFPRTKIVYAKSLKSRPH